MDFDSLAQFQWGLLTWRQLLEHQGEKATLRQIADRRMIRVLPKVYRIAGVPTTWRQRPMAAYLSVGAGGAAALCAGRLLGMPYVPGRRVQIVVPQRTIVRIAGIRAIRSNCLPDSHFTTIDGLRVTNAARAICDMSAHLSAETVARILRGAVRHDLTGYEEVARTRDDLRARGRRRTTVIDQILECRIAGSAPGDSEGEYKLLEWIAGGGFEIPKQQHWVMTDGGRYCLDLAYVHEKIDIEWDSDLHEKTPDDVEYDAARDIELELAGWLVMRQSKLTNRATFLRRLGTALHQRSR